MHFNEKIIRIVQKREIMCSRYVLLKIDLYCVTIQLLLSTTNVFEKKRVGYGYEDKFFFSSVKMNES